GVITVPLGNLIASSSSVLVILLTPSSSVKYGALPFILSVVNALNAYTGLNIVEKVIEHKQIFFKNFTIVWQNEDKYLSSVLLNVEFRFIG
ncbi:hypothetical protein, partial [uncultured Gilliamella sp.]|uniref:hypothetical protein n=1 Tax=uncultured Gilliamella sp. TaxID=1193505 RepID=UPI0025E5C025